MKKYLIYYILAALLLGLLAGCGGSSDKYEPKGGTLYLRTNAVIAVSYNEQGTVTSVTAQSDNAKEIVESYQGYAGKSCSQVVAELVEKVGEGGHLEAKGAIEVTFDKDSGVPETDFAEKLEQVIQNTVKENQWEATVEIEAPVIPTPAPDEQGGVPTKPSVPKNAEKQADGTYILTEYLNRGGNTVDSESEAQFARTEIYNSDGRQISEEKIEIQSGQLRERFSWEYDGNGVCVARSCLKCTSAGVVQENYREEYDAAGRISARSDFDKDGAVVSSTGYSYYDTGKLKTEEEISSGGVTLAKKEYYESGALLSEASYYTDGEPESLKEYGEDGAVVKQTWWHSGNVMRLCEEFHPNGHVKYLKRWNASGIMTYEFVSFHGEDKQNGIMTVYDDNGNMTSRTVEGNPDGSPAITESWYEEDGGTYVMSIYDAPYLAELGEDGNPIRYAKEVESRYKLGDGTYHNHTFDYEKGTHHVIGYWVSSNTTQDMTRSISTDAPIEGYIESTIDGIYSRQEWKDGKKTVQLEDGSNYMGYAVKNTTYYHPNGQVKSFEKYFYADGGRYYAEFDENGNETYLEITTAYY